MTIVKDIKYNLIYIFLSQRNKYLYDDNFIWLLVFTFNINLYFCNRRKNPNKYEALNQRFVEPHVTASREFQGLKALQKRIFMDMQQSEIILNYLADKYTDDHEPEKKRVKFSTIR